MRKRGFTLVEMIIVVAILGIMAAIVIPTFQGNVAQAKESASKTNLATMRSQIELYRLHHNGYQPGYVNGAIMGVATVEPQMTGTTAETGQASSNPTPSVMYPCGPYLREIPPNPFNKRSDITRVLDADAFSAAVDGNSGWLYKIETAEIVLNWPGTDAEGVAFCDY